jgi:hypothetical protein
MRELSIRSPIPTSHPVLSGLGSLPTNKLLMGRNNSRIWKLGVEMFLVTEDLWDLVTSNEINVKNDAKVMS